MTKNEISLIVKDLTKNAGSSRLTDIISYLNIKLKPLKGKTFYAKYKNKKYIFLDPDLDDQLKDFAIAHELGHAVLHDCEIGQSFTYRVKSQQVENEANYFAYTLLDLKIDPIYNYTISQYANLLSVSEDTIKYVVNP